MAQQFIDSLLNDNKIDSEPGQQCHICLSVLGTLPEDGVIEYAIRLSCTHVFGSTCISRWLQDHNTCPCCRRKLYKESIPPHDFPFDEGHAARFVHDLQLSNSTLSLAHGLEDSLYDEEALPGMDHSLRCIAALTVYLASHLLLEPRSAQQVSQASGIQEDHLNRFYRSIYPNRDLIVPTSFPAHFVVQNRTLIQGFWDLLPAPSEIEASMTFSEEADPQRSLPMDSFVVRQPVENPGGELGLITDVTWLDIQDHGEEFCQEMSFDYDMTDMRT